MCKTIGQFVLLPSPSFLAKFHSSICSVDSQIQHEGVLPTNRHSGISKVHHETQQIRCLVWKWMENLYLHFGGFGLRDVGLSVRAQILEKEEGGFRSSE